MKKHYLLGLIPGLLLSGCFNVREPEPLKPDDNPVSGWTSPTQPAILTDNFSNAVRNLNVAVYNRCFTPAFRFRPDPTAAGTGTTVFNNWSVAEEHDYFNSLRNKSPLKKTKAFTLTKTRENFFTPDSLEQFYDYFLQTAHADSALKAQDFTGSMRLVMARHQNEWKIALWEDNKENQPCWTDLKKFFIAR
jgi:hypothetical protein